jgi:hypothetical protein
MTDDAQEADSPGLSRLDLLGLGIGFPCITPAEGARLAEACAVCLEHCGHGLGVLLDVIGDYRVAYELHWPEVHDQMKRSLADLQEATERGACGVAILLIRELTEYHVVERARKGTGIDYWLAVRQDERLGLAARLEVSGILPGDEKLIEKRLKQKLDQTRRSDGTLLPAFVVVVQFSGPVAAVVKR